MSTGSESSPVQEAHPRIILFHYHYSPYAHKISWYLNLRGIKYQECLQPPILPRKDLSSLGITYRRIPLLSIGNDVYCDTFLILRELERRFPTGGLDTAPAQSRKFAARSSALFQYAAGCLPSSLPLLKNPQFVKDRIEFSGRSYGKEDIDAARPEALTSVREAFKYMETQVLADDRRWVLGAELTLADIEAAWPLEWVITIPGALAGSDVAAATFPKTFAYVSRFMAAVAVAGAAVGKIDGAAAAHAILSYCCGPAAGVSGADTLGLAIGDEVEVVPLDTGRGHPQCGRLSGLNEEVVVLEVQPTDRYAGRGTLRIHFPREGYEVRSAGARDSRL